MQYCTDKYLLKYYTATAIAAATTTTPYCYRYCYHYHIPAYYAAAATTASLLCILLGILRLLVLLQQQLLLRIVTILHLYCTACLCYCDILHDMTIDLWSSSPCPPPLATTPDIRPSAPIATAALPFEGTLPHIPENG